MVTRQTIEWQIEDYLRIVQIHRIWILAVTLAGALLGTLRLTQQPNIYQASAKILIESQAPQVVQFREVTPWAGAGMAQQFIATELKIINSRAVAERVLEELNLAAFPPFSKAEDPVAVLQGMIEVDQIRGTKLVEVRATHHKPELAAKLANKTAQAYAQINLERRQEMTTGGAHWLQDEVTRSEQKMKMAQQGLQQFKEQHRNIPVGDEEQNAVLQRLQQLNTAVTETKKQRIEAETKYREKHPVLLELQAKEQDLEQALREQEKIALEMNRFAVEYNNLRRDAQSNEAIYNALLTRLKELSVQEGLQANNVQMVEEARMPESPVGPNRPRGILLSTLLGALFGCGLSLLLESLSKTIRNRSQFENLLEIPFLGHVPLIPAAKNRRKPQRILLLTEPKSAAAESIRAIRTTLEFLLPAGQPQALLITSSLPEEGKSLLSLNLAIAFQELGRRVLLVDADLRRPTMHQSFRIPLEPGLSAYLQEQAQAGDIVQTIPSAKDLPVVTAGLTPAQPTDLLISPRLRELIETWKKEYQVILIDTPPVLAVADTTALASLADGVIYVLRSDRSHRDVVLAGKQRLVDVGAKIVGGVLNVTRIELEHGHRYMYYYRGSERARKRLRPPAQPPAEGPPPEAAPT